MVEVGNVLDGMPWGWGISPSLILFSVVFSSFSFLLFAWYLKHELVVSASFASEQAAVGTRGDMCVSADWWWCLKMVPSAADSSRFTWQGKHTREHRLTAYGKVIHPASWVAL